MIRLQIYGYVDCDVCHLKLQGPKAAEFDPYEVFDPYKTIPAVAHAGDVRYAIYEEATRQGWKIDTQHSKAYCPTHLITQVLGSPVYPVIETPGPNPNNPAPIVKENGVNRPEGK